MKLVIDIDLENMKPEKGDIISFNGEKWILQTHCEAFSCENKRIKEQDEKIKDLENLVEDLKNKIHLIAKAVKEAK